MGYFAGDKQKVEASKQKLVLIMDEVDGMSAGDRGGVGQLAAICRKTQVRSQFTSFMDISLITDRFQSFAFVTSASCKR